MFTKIGSALGAIAFALLAAIGTHQYVEVHNYVPPPSLEQTFKNVVAITTSSDYCSGWVLKGSHQVVTAAHCAPEDQTAIMNVDFGDGKLHPFHIQHIGDMMAVTGPDLMTLTTNDTTVPWPAGLAVCTFKPYYGEALTMFGGPLGFSWSASFGNVSNPTVDLTDLMTLNNVPKFATNYIQYDGAMWPGNSGGAAVDDQFGCVMGSSDLIRTAAPESGFPDGVKFLVPATDLELINK